jgi:hypothetical protein
LQPLKEALKTAVSIGHLNEIRRNLKRVMKHLHLPENPQDSAEPEMARPEVKVAQRLEAAEPSEK